MGGSGSGRYTWRNRGTVEGRPGVSAAMLRREGGLRVGGISTLRWNWGRGGESWVSVIAKASSVVFAWKTDGQPRGHEVRLEWQTCRFGGARPWFRCPALGCGRRVLWLHLAGGAFVCRKCGRLIYRSQRADLSTRGTMKIRKAYRALGLDPDEAERMENLPKPRGMHWRTFQRHSKAIERGAEMRDAWMLQPSRSLLRFLAKCEQQA